MVISLLGAIVNSPVIPDPSRQLADLIAYITSTKVDISSRQILLPVSLRTEWSALYHTLFDMLIFCVTTVAIYIINP